MDRSRAALALLAFSVLSLSGAGCGPRPGEGKAGRGVLVIVVDGLRADHVGSLGYDRRTTPWLDGLAGEGATFTQAFTASPELLAAHAAILSGCDPMLARRVAIGAPSRGTPVSDWYLADEIPRLPRAFLAHGYATAAFADHPVISPVCGFGAGFQEFFGFDSARRPRDSEIGSEGIGQRFLNWLSGVDPPQDWFVYLQLDDLERVWLRPDQKRDTFFEPRAELAAVPPVAHDDRVFFALPRGRWDGGTYSIGQQEARYDGALRDLDRNLGRLFEGMRRLGRWDETTIVVLGSHGIGFGESGVIADTGTFSDCDLRVPVIARLARSLEGAASTRGARMTEVFSLVDLAPTLLDLHGIGLPAGMGGVSHAAVLRGDPGSIASASIASVREVAFAAGGLQGGFVAIDVRWCFEESSPGALEQDAVSSVSRSWYGDERRHRGEVRTFLHDRSASGSKGHLGESAADPDATARLSAAGREHYQWIEEARQVLQAAPGVRAGIDPALIEELRRRRLLANGDADR